MSISALIVIQLVFLLLASWFFAALVIRKLRNTRDEQASLIRELRRKRQQSASPVSAKVAMSARDVAMADDAEPVQTEDLAAVLNDLGSEFDNSFQNTQELNHLLEAQSASILRLKKMREAMEEKGKNTDAGVFNQELSTLKKKNQRSETIIAELNARLDSSRTRMMAVEGQLTRLKASAGQVVALEHENKRLSMDRSRLEQKLQREMFKHQQVIDRIQAKLSMAESRSKEGIHKAKMREQSLVNVIAELKGKLKNTATVNKTDDEINMLKVELTTAQEALNRAINEKAFLESNFLDLEQALNESMQAKEELERTRKEYQMLESHFLALEQEREEKQKENEVDIPESRKNLETLSPVEVASQAASETSSQ